MKLSLKQLILISRPRFWMYVLGTFLVGMIAAGNPFNYNFFIVLKLVLFSIFFSFPANLFIYGVNDIYDYQTDILNDKKINYESFLSPEYHRFLWKVIGIMLLPLLGLFFFINTHTIIALIIFLFTGFFYSAGPIRAKSKPFLDILFSSTIYVTPAIIGYFLTDNTQVSWLAVISGIIWACAMQTYSAVPDIEADSKAGIQTLATYLGAKKALYFCLIANFVFSLMSYFMVGYLALIFGVVYIGIVLFSITNAKKVFKYYTYFPLVNVVAGATLYFYLFSKVI